MIPPRGSDCIVCGTADASVVEAGGKVQYTCPRCGTFTLTDSAQAVLPGKLDSDIARRSKMSHVLRKAQSSSGFDIKPIKSDELESYWSLDRLPNPIEATNHLVLWLGENQEYPHRLATPTTSEIAAYIGWPIDPNGTDGAGLGWLFSMIDPKGLFHRTSGSGAGFLSSSRLMGGRSTQSCCTCGWRVGQLSWRCDLVMQHLSEWSRLL